MLDSRVNNLNNDVFQVLKQVSNKNNLNKDDIIKIKDAILKDNKIDNNEIDLIDELTHSQGKINISSGNKTVAVNTLKGSADEVINLLDDIKQIGNSFEDINESSSSFSLANIIGLVADITGIFDPTPVSDGVSGVISLGQGDFKGAGLSLASMIPYVGDLAAKPVKIMGRVLDSFPALSRLLKSADDVPKLLDTLKKLGPSATDASKVGDVLTALNNLQKKAEIAYSNPKFLEKAKSLKLPTEGPIPFVPPKGWNTSNPLRTDDKKGFIDAFGNEWRKGPSRTPGQDFEWDVIPKSKDSGISHLSRDGSHINVSLDGVVTHK